MITVHLHKEVERYKVSCESEESLNSLKSNLINNYGFEVIKEWLDVFNGKVAFFALFEREDSDLLAGKNE